MGTVLLGLSERAEVSLSLGEHLEPGTLLSLVLVVLTHVSSCQQRGALNSDWTRLAAVTLLAQCTLGAPCSCCVNSYEFLGLCKTHTCSLQRNETHGVIYHRKETRRWKRKAARDLSDGQQRLPSHLGPRLLVQR